MAPPVQKIQTILGTMVFGKEASGKTDFSTIASVTDKNEIKQFFNFFMQNGFIVFDTARMYCSGSTEEVMGEIGIEKGIIHSKAYPGYNGEGLTYDNVLRQLNDTLKALKREYVDLYYLHWPDHNTPIIESLRAINDLFIQGKIKSFGLSNYASWQISQICTICQYEGWVLPTVYQGMYNAITRDVEKELIPCLRKFNMKFYVYNPLAGGLLAKTYSFDDIPSAGRFTSTSTWGQRYRERYWKKESFEALSKLASVCDKHSITVRDAAMRWLYHHSVLSNDYADGVIIGASKVSHLQDNIASAQSGPLPQDVVDALDDACETFKPVCPNYFR